MAALAPRLAPADAAAVARRVVEVMRDDRDEDVPRALAQALTALAPRLAAADAAADARLALDRMAETRKCDQLLAIPLLAGRMQAAEAAQVCRRVLTTLGDPYY
jgi:hypothetical protein